MAKARIMSAGGIGESKLHGGSDTGPDSARIARLNTCHVNGVPIPDLHLSDRVLSVLDYYATDEGIAEKNADPKRHYSDGQPAHGITTGKEDFEKSLDQRRDDVKTRDMPLNQARDPLKEVAERYKQPGMRAKFLSRSRIKDSGGTGDYVVVKQENGDPVMVKGMVLGHAPEDLVAERLRGYQDHGNQILKQIGEKHKQENAGDAALVDQGNR